MKKSILVFFLGVLLGELYSVVGQTYGFRSPFMLVLSEPQVAEEKGIEQPSRLYRVVEGQTALELQQELNRLQQENCNPVLMSSYRGADHAVVVLECLEWR